LCSLLSALSKSFLLILLYQKYHINSVKPTFFNAKPSSKMITFRSKNVKILREENPLEKRKFVSLSVGFFGSVWQEYKACGRGGI